MNTKNEQKKQSFFSDRDSVINFYKKYGYHIEYGVHSDDECEELIKAGMSLQAPKNGIYKPAMMPHREDAVFLKGLKSPKVVKIMNEFVGGEAAGLQTEFFFCKPGTRGFSLHQDNFYVEAEEGVFASAWMALTDTYFEKGGLIVYPETNRAGQLPVRKLNIGADPNQDPNANNEETAVPSCYVPMNISVPRGAVLFIHGHLVHGSNPNLTDEWRYVLLCTYIRKGCAFRAGAYAKREEIELD